MSTLSGALAPSTWRGQISVARRMMDFRVQWEAWTGHPLAVDEAILLWLSKKSVVDGLKPSALLQYLQNLKAWAKRAGFLEHPTPMLRDLERSYKRSGALRPSRQAVPADLATVRQAIDGESSPVVRVALEVAFKAAARVGDLLKLDVRALSFEDSYVGFDWSGGKSDPFRLGRTTGVALSPQAFDFLQTRCRSLPPDAPAFPTTRQKLVAALRRVDPQLSGHSLRRGALMHLMQKGHSLAEMMSVSRHATVESLLHYIPLAKAHPAREAVRVSASLDLWQ